MRQVPTSELRTGRRLWLRLVVVIACVTALLVIAALLLPWLRSLLAVFIIFCLFLLLALWRQG